MKPKKQPFIIGRQPIVEALKSGRPIERIFILRSASGEIISTIRDLAHRDGVPVNAVPEEKLHRLSRGNHQGCIAIASLVAYHELQDVISFIVDKGEVPLFVLLDGITDVRNVGAIARSVLCCGAQAIVLPDRGIAPLNEEAMKASAGALEHLYICRESSLLKSVETLHLNGFTVLAADGKAEKFLRDCSWNQPTAVIMGAEDLGVQAPLLKAADLRFRIPMAGAFDSFNVSVATGIVLYEAMIQRMEP